MSKNTGKVYEKLTQFVFDQILNENNNDIHNIAVKHDVNIKGKTLTHQIDVYWEFEIGGMIYRSIVQAKDWKDKVPQKEMLAFKAIIDDMPSGTLGIYVCRSGYQSGAIECAKINGIHIYELRVPKDSDWDAANNKKLQLETKIITPRFKNAGVSLDKEWIKNNFPSLIEKKFTMKYTEKTKLYDKSKNAITTIIDIFILMNASDESEEWKTLVYNAEEKENFIYFDEIDKYIKIKNITVDMLIELSTMTISCDASTIVGMVLKDMLSGEKRIFNKSNYILK